MNTLGALNPVTGSLPGTSSTFVAPAAGCAGLMFRRTIFSHRQLLAEKFTSLEVKTSQNS